MQSNSQDKTFSIGTILKESFFLYKENFFLLFFIEFLCNIFFLIDQLLSSLKISTGWSYPIMFLAGILISCWGHIALIFAVSRVSLSQEIGIKEAFVATKDKIFRFIATSGYFFLFLIVGFLLFVIPAFYLDIIFSLAGVVIVLENATLFESFKRSANLIRGYFWPVLFLHLILLALLVPTFFVYKLNIGNTKFLIVTFITMLLGPWFQAIEVNVYNKLNNIKGSDGNVEIGNVVKNGIGCLGAIGLCVVIVILSIFWFRTLGNFLKTEKGNKVYEWVAEKVSPKIELVDGVVVERPKDYLVIKAKKYTFYPSLYKKGFVVNVFAVSVKDLGIKDIKSIKEGEVWDKYHSYLVRQSPFLESAYSKMDKDSVETFTLNERSWTRYKLKEKPNKSRRPPKEWIFDYTLTDDAVIFVTYGYKSNTRNELEDNEQIQRILNGFHINEQK